MLTINEFMFMPRVQETEKRRERLTPAQRAEILAKTPPVVDRSGWWEETGKAYGVTGRYIRKLFKKARDAAHRY